MKVHVEPDTRLTIARLIPPRIELRFHIAEIVCLDELSPDVEIALHIDGVRQDSVLASSIYVENGLKEMTGKFAGYEIAYCDLIIFVIKPTATVSERMDFKLRVKLVLSYCPIWLSSQNRSLVDQGSLDDWRFQLKSSTCSDYES